MTLDTRLLCERFPRSSLDNADWLVAGTSGGANPLWLTEWLAGSLDLRPGMRVLDLGCGRAASSIFLRREFGVQVWATDLWFSASENLQRIVVGRRQTAAELAEPIVSVPTQYTQKPLLRGQ